MEFEKRCRFRSLLPWVLILLSLSWVMTNISMPKLEILLNGYVNNANAAMLEQLAFDKYALGNSEILRIHHSHSRFNAETPSYSVYVFSDGTVIFGGDRSVKTVGEAKHKLSPRQMGELVARIRKLKLPDIKPNKYAGQPGYEFLAVVYSSVDDRDGRFFVDGYYDVNVRLYKELRTSIEEYLQTWKYRCPVSNPVRLVQGKLIDICALVIEFE